MTCFLASHSHIDTQGVSITPSVHVFGDVRQGDRLEYSGKIQNRSAEAIVLKRTLSSCSCITAGLSRGQQLLPGKTAVVSAEWDIRGSYGTVTTTIGVEYCLAGQQNMDGSIEGIVVTKLVANVLPDYRIEPEQMVVRTNSTTTMERFTFRPNFPGIELIDVISNHPALQPKIVRRDDDGLVTVAVVFDPADYDPRLLLSIELRWKTTSVAAPVFRTPVIVQ